jgi:hypothetical protein
MGIRWTDVKAGMDKGVGLGVAVVKACMYMGMDKCMC